MHEGTSERIVEAFEPIRLPAVRPRVGVVLAAGRSQRLSQITRDGSKALIPLGGMSLVERAVRGLLACGLEQVVVVVGYQAGTVGTIVSGLDPGRVHLVYAEGWEAGNGASLAAAEPFVGEEELFVLVTADHVFAEGALDALLAAGGPAALVDTGPGSDVWSAGTRVRIVDGRARAFGTHLIDDMCQIWVLRVVAIAVFAGMPVGLCILTHVGDRVLSVVIACVVLSILLISGATAPDRAGTDVVAGWTSGVLATSTGNQRSTARAGADAWGVPPPSSTPRCPLVRAPGYRGHGQLSGDRAVQPAKKAASTSATDPGWSSGRKCPALGTFARRASGIASAKRRPNSGASQPSCSPHITSVGVRISP